MRFARFFLLFLCLNVFHSLSAQNSQDSLYMRMHYTKEEKMIKMRDGISLFTSVYIPTDLSKKHPIIMVRTPYSCRPYGVEKFAELYNTYHKYYLRAGYIIVFQDVRGRFMSEGVFEDIRPFITNKKSSKDIDEASDTYDTVDWLVNNVANNNGNVGIMGISYPGFYATMAALSGHPALKAVSPQAPVTDWFRGDDFHHNGAFALMDAFNFYRSFGLPRPNPLKQYASVKSKFSEDSYDFMLKAGALSDIKKNYFGDSLQFMNDMYAHPDLDKFWADRNPLPHLNDIKPAVMVVGGLFDAEDCYGAWNTFKTLESQSSSSDNMLVMGPWYHGNWGGRGDGASIGNVKFGQKTAEWYQNEMEIPFFKKYLEDSPNKMVGGKVNVFITGENNWHKFETWPPSGSRPYKLYLTSENGLSQNATLAKAAGSDSYISDPAHPVPYRSDIGWHRTREYMLDDQRFTSQRTDVLTYQSDILEEDLTAIGPVIADLFVKLSTTDADFVVKIIDVFPDDFKEYASDKVPMGGYQMLVRGEIMRGRYRNSFSDPEGFKPGKDDRVKFNLPDIAHNFRKGHRIMVQIQSSWFPLFDRNPQQFVNIYTCKQSDFVKSKVEVLRDKLHPSSIEFLIK